jgi:hypothetical protein
VEGDHRTLSSSVSELTDKVNHLIEMTKLNSQALDWLVLEKKKRQRRR